MALCRLNVPSLMLYGGSIMPGHFHGEQVTVQEVFEAVGKYDAGTIPEEELAELEAVASPGPGACGGQFTANTMAMAYEMLGISPIGDSLTPAQEASKPEIGILSVAASGGSTNGVLHLLALAREAGVELEIDDFDAISERTPLLCDLKPGGRYVAVDLHEAGGVPLL